MPMLESLLAFSSCSCTFPLLIFCIRNLLKLISGLRVHTVRLFERIVYTPVFQPGSFCRICLTEIANDFSVRGCNSDSLTALSVRFISFGDSCGRYFLTLPRAASVLLAPLLSTDCSSFRFNPFHALTLGLTHFVSALLPGISCRNFLFLFVRFNATSTFLSENFLCRIRLRFSTPIVSILLSPRFIEYHTCITGSSTIAIEAIIV